MNLKQSKTDQGSVVAQKPLDVMRSQIIDNLRKGIQTQAMHDVKRHINALRRQIATKQTRD